MRKRHGIGGENGGSRDSEAAAPYTFTIQYPNTVHGPTIGPDSESGADSFMGGDPASPASAIPSQGNVGDSETPPHTPSSIAMGSTPPAHQVQWATPPTDASADTDEGPRRYKTISDLLDSTDEVTDMEYSGLCLVAAEEPGSVEEAMSEHCWREARGLRCKPLSRIEPGMCLTCQQSKRP
jgi:hypothetical protein